MTLLYIDDYISDPVTPQQYFIGWGLLVFFVVAFLLRNSAYFGFMWRWGKLFFIALLIAIFADRIKKDIKDWWKED
jgi:hypothetical protein